MPHRGKNSPVGAELCGRLASSGLLDGHLTNNTSELQPAGPLTPDSVVSVVDTELERIEKEFPFMSNALFFFFVL